jgi:hypothetical protein
MLFEVAAEDKVVLTIIYVAVSKLFVLADIVCVIAEEGKTRANLM